MRTLQIVIALVIAMSAPAFAQDAGIETTTKAAPVSAFRVAMSEVAILRYRAALKLKAEQEKYWPAVANALRVLAREPSLNEQVVRRIAPSVTPFLTTLDDRQRGVAMSFAQRAGLTQYAAMF